MAFATQHYEERLDRLESIVERLAEAELRTEERLEALAEAQRRTEERLERLEATVERLAEAQHRTEERLDALAEAQRRTEERLERLEATVERLVEAQRRTEERMERLEATVERLAEAQRRTEERLVALAEAQRRTEERLERLEAAVERLTEVLADHTDTIGDLKGRMLELDYHRKAGAYFGPLLRRTRVQEHHVLADELEPHLSQGELRDALLIDLMVRGLPRIRPELPEVLLAVEVSSVVDREDVNRARRRAALLRPAGYPVIPAVAGEKVTLGAEDEIQHHKVLLLQDGAASQWEEALEALSTSRTDSWGDRAEN